MTDSNDDDDRPFWERKTLLEMTPEEWESLCDGCGRCCLNKLISDDNDIFFTDAACRLLNLEKCRCGNYENRVCEVPDCVVLTADNISGFRWMTSTCAYRLLAEGKPLYDWHPLVSGDPESVHKAGISVRGRAISEQDVTDLDQRIVDWPA